MRRKQKLGQTKSAEAILNRRRRARRAEGGMPGVISVRANRTSGSLRISVESTRAVPQLLPESQGVLRDQLIESLLLVDPVVLIEKSDGARAGVPCRANSGHDLLPCDSE